MPVVQAGIRRTVRDSGTQPGSEERLPLVRVKNYQHERRCYRIYENEAQHQRRYQTEMKIQRRIKREMAGRILRWPEIPAPWRTHSVRPPPFECGEDVSTAGCHSND